MIDWAKGLAAMALAVATSGCVIAVDNDAPVRTVSSEPTAAGVDAPEDRRGCGVHFAEAEDRRRGGKTDTAIAGVADHEL